jgi:endonuclease-8
MPEGDNIFRAAERLRAALAGRPVTDFRTVLPQLQRVHDDHPVTGRVIEQVRSAGKNLLMYFSGDLVLRTHMLMSGSWHLYRRGERWRRPGADMRIVIANEEFEAVGFSVPVAEFLTARQMERHRQLQQLGPDLLAEEFDREAARERIRSRPELEIAEALLLQRLIAGIGNVFKSEVCFAAGVAPSRKVVDVSESEMEQILDSAEKQLRLNVSGRESSRWTTGRLNPSERLWVYGRGGKPCFRCGTAIQWKRMGRDARSTYWCPGCQK